MDLLLDSESPLSLFSRILCLYTRAVASLHTLSASSARLLKISTPALVSENRIIRHPLSLALEVVRKSATEILLGSTPAQKAQVSSWVELANTMEKKEFLAYLDEALLSRTFLVSNHITVADISAYSAMFTLLARDSKDEDKRKVINVVRWVRHLQSLPGFTEAVGAAIEFSPAVFLPAAQGEGREDKHEGKKPPKEEKKHEGEERAKPADEPKKSADEPKKPADEPKKPAEEHKKPAKERKIPTEEHKKPKKQPTEEDKKAQEEHKKPAKEPKKPTEESKGQPKGGKKPAAAESVSDPASVLDMRVGRIVKIWRHPTREHIFCEDVDMGNGEMRTIASGLVGYVTEEQMTNSLVVILGNLKPRKMDDFISQGMVLCASFNEGIEPLRPPATCEVGERIVIEGLPSNPLPELPPKKQYWEAAMKELRVDAEGRATYKSQPLTTSHGVIISPTFKAGTIS